MHLPGDLHGRPQPTPATHYLPQQACGHPPASKPYTVTLARHTNAQQMAYSEQVWTPVLSQKSPRWPSTKGCKRQWVNSRCCTMWVRTQSIQGFMAFCGFLKWHLILPMSFSISANPVFMSQGAQQRHLNSFTFEF